MQHKNKNNHPRAIAARIIKSVIIDKKEFTSLNHPLIQPLSDLQSRSLTRYLCFQVLRFYPKLECLANHFINKKLKSKDQDIWALILIGLFELQDKPEQAYMIVNETVKGATMLKKEWAKNLINAILRAYIRQQAALPNTITSTIEYQTAHPQWLGEKIQTAWPQDWEAIIAANNQQAPLCLRVNQTLYSRDEYAKILDSHNIHYQFIPHTAMGVCLESAMDVYLLPGFEQGSVCVQDGAGQLAVELLELAPGLKILDACAAPGSKTGHILETQPSTELLAIDLSAPRVQQLKQTLERIGVNQDKVHIKIANSSEPATWYEPSQGLFDRILLDAPCSALGVIRRHPDIKLLRTPEQIKLVCQEQKKLLHALWPLLKPGGILLYATCSILPQENEKQIEEFYQHILSTENNMHIIPIEAPFGIALQYGKQILPGQSNMDGFYYAKLRKV